MENFVLDGNRRIKKYDIHIVDGEEVLVSTKAYSEWKNSKKIIYVLREAGINPRVTNLSFDTYIGPDRPGNIEKLKKYVIEFETYKNKHLYLWSKQNGTQKTTMASVVAKEILLSTKFKYKVKFTFMNHLIQLLMRESFEEYSIELEIIRQADFLVIDDSFDKDKVTIYKSGYQYAFLDLFLRSRLEGHPKATCFTANFAPEEIAASFNASFANLIKRNCYPMHFRDSYTLKDDFDPEEMWK